MRVILVAGVCAVLLGGGAGPSTPMLAAQSPLPDGPGRDITIKVCGTCHAAEIAASVRLSPDGWHELIDRMVSAGAQGSEAELKTVFEYLSTHFPVEEQATLDLNTASALDLETVAGLLRREAAALISYREKNGPCRKLEDLKNVEGLDYQKIEARKERLACR
ncbi:MAG TPA: helix-hairpin-helix domain-containing protein [Vicinamibacterales bacterium]|nr:helix-hairpin-helix domain-containing protein [Vicinamibacterales bacterium]